MTGRSLVSSCARAAAVVVAVANLTGCSLNTMAARMVADTLSQSGDAYSRDDDPELVRLAVPFALKTYESLLETIPRHEKLLIATCSGFTQYAYAFVQNDAEIVQFDDHEQAQLLKERAVKLYLRAKDYCFRALAMRFRGIEDAILQDPVAALAKAEKRDVPLLYWSAASWGLAIGLHTDMAIDLPSVRALAERGLALDEAWNKGALHDILITLESQGAVLGGSEDRARKHFARAVELQKGLSPRPYLSLATGISVSKQDRAEFEKLVNEALAVDPAKDKSNQLVTLITKRRAQALLTHIDQLFAK
jgi:predicted anti-sigma-YlaC factor YlaD